MMQNKCLPSFFFACRYTVFFTSFVEEMVLPHCVVLEPLLKIIWSYAKGFLLSFLFCSIGLSVRARSFQSCPTLCLWDSSARILEWVACPSPGSFPDPGMEPWSLMSPALASGFFTTSAIWETLCIWLYASTVPFWLLLLTCLITCIEIRKNETPSFVFISQDCFGYLESFEIPYVFWKIFLFLKKMPLGFWWWLHWICIMCQVVWTF